MNQIKLRGLIFFPNLKFRRRKGQRVLGIHLEVHGVKCRT